MCIYVCVHIYMNMFAYLKEKKTLKFTVINCCGYYLFLQISYHLIATTEKLFCEMNSVNSY